ncbi:F0F1 ATP synthase subunit alpha [Sesbania bispinosa]|nr:F0F1 ATP synthase subunit alpha [Sesbania bispinosa]
MKGTLPCKPEQGSNLHDRQRSRVSSGQRIRVCTTQQNQPARLTAQCDSIDFHQNGETTLSPKKSQPVEAQNWKEGQLH